MLSKGQKINERYEIVKSIGEGGMANVYLAEDKILERKVAVKVLRGDLSADDKFIRRFEREAQSVSNLSHQNIVEVYDVGVEDGEHYIVMEYIEGKTLKQLLKKRESLTLTEVIDIMTQLTDGMSHAHESYIIHRDIKPQNIMIEDNGLIKITDFGIAMALNATQLTQTNSVMGSVHYLPPEQASGKGSTVKSDIYSLGILMYELLTGNVPFKGDNAVEIALKHMKDKIPSIRKQNPSIPQSVENILIKATAKNPRNRYDSVRAMHEDFIHCLEEEHANDKKVVFEYPENDLDDTQKLEPVKQTSHKAVEKPQKEKISENTMDLVNEITDEDIETKDNQDEEEYEEPKKQNTLITILATFFLLLLITAGIIWIVATQEVTDIEVPSVVGLTTDEALEILKDLGLKPTVKYANHESIPEGHVIKTDPKAKSIIKQGEKITIIESTGGDYYYLENYIGANYNEIKAKLNLLKIHVIVESQDVENQNDYKNKEDLIIAQSPTFEPNAEPHLVEPGDTITLYIPKIIDEYPDMVNEGWTLNDAIAFAKEHKLNLKVYDSTTNMIPENEYNTYSNTKIISQDKPVGYEIITGLSFSVNLNTQYKVNEETNENQESTEN
jgi:serine/threonine-protein kinase